MVRCWKMKVVVKIQTIYPNFHFWPNHCKNTTWRDYKKTIQVFRIWLIYLNGSLTVTEIKDDTISTVEKKKWGEEERGCILEWSVFTIPLRQMLTSLAIISSCALMNSGKASHTTANGIKILWSVCDSGSWLLVRLESSGPALSAPSMPN